MPERSPTTAGRFLLIHPGGLLGVRVIALGDALAEVVVVLFQAIKGVQLAVAVFIGERGEVVDTEINTYCLLTRDFIHVDFDLTDELQFPLVACPDNLDLLDILHGGKINVGESLVLAQYKIRPILFEIRPF
jgi:hypothetical protein